MERKWWHDKVAYQIYPKSFCDSNGDGIGDLRGIIGKLDYLKELGADIIWISPFYCSPLADQGYDISDYYGIDPVFGTMEDFDELLAEAKKRQLSIVLDLVINHCSDEHEWFRKACEDPDGPYGKFFYIVDRGENDTPPTNWRSYFGGSCWEPLPGHPDKWYLHLFHKKQPDLNWENPELREKIYQMINWWQEKGVDGFRIDAIINIRKPLPFSDYPADRPDGMVASYHVIDHADGIHELLHELADRTFRPYNTFTVGEVFNDKPGQLEKFIGDNGCFSSMFDFAENLLNDDGRGWYSRVPVTPDQYKMAAFRSQEKSEGIGFLSNIIENHDEPRGVSRYLPEGECSEDAKKMLGGLYFFLKGLPFIYQGQELGMENVPFTDISEINDINTIDEYQVALSAGLTPEEALEKVTRYSRDNTRCPMHWSNTENAGFTTGIPWLKVNPNYTEINYEEQKGRESSVYEWYRRMIRVRKSPEWKETLIYGTTVPVRTEQKNLMAYLRRGEKTILAVGNFQKEPQDLVLDTTPVSVLLNNKETLETENKILHLKGYQFVLLVL